MLIKVSLSQWDVLAADWITSAFCKLHFFRMAFKSSGEFSISSIIIWIISCMYKTSPISMSASPKSNKTLLFYRALWTAISRRSSLLHTRIKEPVYLTAQYSPCTNPNLKLSRKQFYVLAQSPLVPVEKYHHFRMSAICIIFSKDYLWAEVQKHLRSPKNHSSPSHKSSVRTKPSLQSAGVCFHNEYLSQLIGVLNFCDGGCTRRSWLNDLSVMLHNMQHWFLGNKAFWQDWKGCKWVKFHPT